ncbi:unnamed protein product [Caenorhabditis auriculariae]|uniref:CX domain-containing protein n=1 Tax=Caenorhabditis auriculariae TaxID=2777116 RepID=A0A8S1GUF2_9PELO|nr:unnamed protein product [Caenorhabditis auriculariae]
MQRADREKRQFFQQTRSLSNGYASDGNPLLNEDVYNIFMQTILHGFNVFKIKMYNDRAFIYRTRRSYWLGDRYYYMDNRYYLPTRDTCAYRMNETQRKDLYYEEDNTPIFDIIYQCQRYVEYCCGLDCCMIDQINRPPDRPHHMKYPWSDPNGSSGLHTGMCFCRWCDRLRPNPLLFVFCVSFCCLAFGLCIAIYDINQYGSGLYLALVSVVTVVVVLAFCLVGTEEQTEPTVAKKVWSTTRQTMRRFKKDSPGGAGVEIRIVNIDIDAEAARTSSSDSYSAPDSHRALANCEVSV